MVLSREWRRFLFIFSVFITSAVVFVFIESSIRRPSLHYYSKPATHDLLKEELGRSTWTLLHNMAAKFNPEPNIAEIKEFGDFLMYLFKNYPCRECSKEIQKILEKNPLQWTNAIQLQDWLCKIHNFVNKRLGKEQFDCSRLDDRWDCGCSLDVK